MPIGSGFTQEAADRLYASAQTPSRVPVLQDSTYGVYAPRFVSLGLDAVTPAGYLAIHAEGGIVAGHSPNYGYGQVQLPEAIDPTKPWRFGCLIRVSSADTRLCIVTLCNQAGSAWSGCSVSISSLSASLSMGGSSWVINVGAADGGIADGTELWFWAASDGASVWSGLWPLGGDHGLSVFPTNGQTYKSVLWKEQPVGQLYAGDPAKEVWGLSSDASRIRLVKIQTASVGARVLAMYLNQGSLAGPLDASFSPPCVMRPRVFQDGRPWVLVPPGQGARSVDLVQSMHGNGHPSEIAMVTGAVTNGEWLGKLLSAGFLVLAVQGGQASTADKSDGDNWGAPCGLKYRRAMELWVRAAFPYTRHHFVCAQSMEFLNALNYAMAWPGSVRGIVGVSGVTNLSDMVANHARQTIVQQAYGRRYVCVQAGTGQDPATQTAYWRPITFGNEAPADSFYLPPYVDRDLYDAGAAYSVNDRVCLQGAGTAAAYAGFDPMLNVGRLASVPMALWHGDADTTVPPSHMTGFASAMNAAGGSVTTHSVPGAGHLDVAGLWDGSAMVEFFKSLR